VDDELAGLHRIPLLIVDEVGYIPFDPRGRQPDVHARQPPLRARQPDRNLQQAVQRLRPIFGDDVGTAAMIDRLIHRRDPPLKATATASGAATSRAHRPPGPPEPP
jgi:IstB-like ATP binding protein